MQNSVGLLETEFLRWNLSDPHIHAYFKTNQGKNSKQNWGHVIKGPQLLKKYMSSFYKVWVILCL